jgi:hypothetical protein
MHNTEGFSNKRRHFYAALRQLFRLGMLASEERRPGVHGQYELAQRDWGLARRYHPHQVFNRLQRLYLLFNSKLVGGLKAHIRDLAVQVCHCCWAQFLKLSWRRSRVSFSCLPWGICRIHQLKGEDLGSICSIISVHPTRCVAICLHENYITSWRALHVLMYSLWSF